MTFWIILRGSNILQFWNGKRKLSKCLQWSCVLPGEEAVRTVELLQQWYWVTHSLVWKTCNCPTTAGSLLGTWLFSGIQVFFLLRSEKQPTKQQQPNKNQNKTNHNKAEKTKSNQQEKQKGLYNLQSFLTTESLLFGLILKKPIHLKTFKKLQTPLLL